MFIPKLDQLIRVFGKIRVVMYLADNFTGWEIGAAWDDAKFGLQYRKDFEKIAVVGGPKWVEWSTKICSHFIGSQAKTYDSSEIQAAISWVKE